MVDRPALIVADRVLVRYLAWSGEDVELTRAAISSLLEPARAAAATIGGGTHLVTINDLSFVVREGVVVHLMVGAGVAARARALSPRK